MYKQFSVRLICLLTFRTQGDFTERSIPVKAEMRQRSSLGKTGACPLMLPLLLQKNAFLVKPLAAFAKDTFLSFLSLCPQPCFAPVYFIFDAFFHLFSDVVVISTHLLVKSAAACCSGPLRAPKSIFFLFFG